MSASAEHVGPAHLAGVPIQPPMRETSGENTISVARARRFWSGTGRCSPLLRLSVLFARLSPIRYTWPAGTVSSFTMIEEEFWIANFDIGLVRRRAVDDGAPGSDGDAVEGSNVQGRSISSFSPLPFTSGLAA